MFSIAEMEVSRVLDCCIVCGADEEFIKMNKVKYYPVREEKVYAYKICVTCVNKYVTKRLNQKSKFVAG